jgi:hypothetical protein
VTHYREYRHYSPTFGMNAVRLSMVDWHGGEFWRIIAIDGNAEKYREDRDLALDAIEDAIARGDDPGEVSDESAGG